MSAGGFKVDFSWYYKGTDKKFDFNKPLNEDAEIEMKMYNGLFDNNLLTDIDSMIKKQ